MTKTSRTAIALLAGLSAVTLRAQTQRPAPTVVWAAKPVETPAYTPPLSPLILTVCHDGLRCPR